MRKVILSNLVACVLLISGQAFGQGGSEGFRVGGNTQIDAQYYYPDSIIGADTVPEKMLMNGYTNIILTKGGFTAGFRYEAYQNPLLGFSTDFEGQGIPYRYATYAEDNIEVTLGNYYEQFGSGMIYRTYEARTLGYDNVMDGFRVKYTPYKGVYMKGIWGKQRRYWDLGEGIVRGIDGEIHLNEVLNDSVERKSSWIFGGSFVSKYQEDRDPLMVLPENVGSYAGRFQFISGGFQLSGEMAHKINDPSRDNNLIYKDGNALLLTTTYSRKGLGIFLSGKVVDNMSYRSDRTASANDLMINFHPALTKQHTYALAATLYPYATQPNGEMAVQAEVSYRIKKKTKLGGKYGTSITVNISAVNSLDTTTVLTNNDSINRRLGYETNYFNVGGEKYFHDYNIEIKRKFSKKFKAAYTYLNLLYNMNVVQGLQTKGTILSNIHILEASLKLPKKWTVRTELQHLGVSKDEKYYKDQGNWAFGLIEFTKSPHWFFTVLDQYNYGNDVESSRVHYLSGTIGYIKNQHRIQLGYGRQRAGIFCVGGVCRNVPAANGFTFSLTSSF